MSSPHDVLERNLELLLTRAYEPARPSPLLRARLSSAIEFEFGARAGGATGPTSARSRPARPTRPTRPTRPARPPRPPRHRLPIAAAALLAFGVAIAAALWFGGRRSSASLDSILARGEHAWREHAPSESARPWNACAAKDRGFEHPGGALELAAASQHDWRVWLGGEGSAMLAEGARAQLDFQSGVHTLAAVLERGALTLERLASGGAWRIDTVQGDFELARGELELAYVGPQLADGTRTLRARLEDGEAWLVENGERRALAIRQTLTVRGGRVLETPALASTAADGRRVAVDPTRRAPVDPDAANGNGATSATSTATLVARLELPHGARPTQSWSATLIPLLRLPDIGDPRTRTFEAEARPDASSDAPGFTWSGLASGNYELFVNVPGRATWRTSELVLGAGETLSIVVAPASPARALGRIVDARSGAPIADAHVISETDLPSPVAPFDFEHHSERDDWRTSVAHTRSASDGSFELGALSPGRHVLRASAPGYGAVWTDVVELQPGVVLEGLELRLAPGGSIGGRVRDEHGKPRADRHLLASHIDFGAPRRCISYGYATSDNLGEFVIDDLPSGAYVVLELDDVSISPRVRQIVVRAPERANIDLGGDQRGARLTLRARLADGRPAAEIDLSIELSASPADSTRRWQSNRTDAQGRATFDGIASGRYEIVAGRNMGSQLACVASVEVADVPELTLDVVLPASACHGRVTAAGELAPTACAVILQRKEGDAFVFGGRVLTDARGEWTCEFLQPGRWRALVFAPGGSSGRWAPAVSAEFEIASAAASIGASSAARSPQIDVDLGPGAALGVRTRDASGAPLGRVNLTFVDAHGDAFQFSELDQTDDRGVLEIPGLAAGRWTVRGIREGFEAVSTTIDLETGARGELELRLRTTGAPK